MFIGQEKIIKELYLLTEDIRNGVNHNIMLRAPSGYGKTTLAYSYISALNKLGWTYYIPKDGILYPDFNYKTVIQVLDEVHTLKEVEWLYPLLDSGKYSFLLLSNETGGLKEPLRNRCIQLIFERYNDEDLEKILKKSFDFPDTFIKEIIPFCKGNPRILLKLGERLEYIFKFKQPTNTDELINIFNDILNLKQGRDAAERTYIDFLSRIGGQASLQTILGGTHLDKNHVLFEIEPSLIVEGMLEITNRGRKLLGEK